MEANTKPNRIHPLVAGAAIAVILVSFTGIAALTGLLPNSHGGSAPVTQLASSVGSSTAATSPANLLDAQKPEEPALQTKEEAGEPMTNPSPAAQAKASPPNRTAYSEPAPAKTPSAPPVCHNCGRVESVQAIRTPAQGSGVGMVAGAVLGGVLGNQVGGGNGRKLATVAGAVGGGYAGNEIEKHTRANTSYQVRVRMEDGDLRTFSFNDQPAWSAGDRVRVVNGHLRSRG